MTTRATGNATVRLVNGRADGELVAEIRGEDLTLRPKGARRHGDRVVVVPWTTIYRNAILTRALHRRKHDRD